MKKINDQNSIQYFILNKKIREKKIFILEGVLMSVKNWIVEIHQRNMIVRSPHIHFMLRLYFLNCIKLFEFKQKCFDKKVECVFQNAIHKHVPKGLFHRQISCLGLHGISYSLQTNCLYKNIFGPLHFDFYFDRQPIHIKWNQY